MAVWGKLNKREQRFVELYPARKFNGTKAAAEAGYSKRRAAQTAVELLKRPHIQQALAEKYAELNIATDNDAKDVIQELKRVGYADIKDLLEYTEDSVTLKDSEGLEERVSRAVKSVSIVPGRFGNTVKLETHSKMDALDKLGRYHALFKDVNIHEGRVPVEDLSKVDDEELDKRIADMEKRQKVLEGKATKKKAKKK